MADDTTAIHNPLNCGGRADGNVGRTHRGEIHGSLDGSSFEGEGGGEASLGLDSRHRHRNGDDIFMEDETPTDQGSWTHRGDQGEGDHLGSCVRVGPRC